MVEPQLVDEGYLFFVMEYVAGGDLRKAVLDGKVSGEAGLDVIHGIAEALAFAHARGVIHRDIKPANILLGEDGQPKLTDFDLVRAFDTTGGTRTGSVLGTFPYLAPEALGQSKDVGVAAEVYSLAMTATFVLHGRDLPPEVLWESVSFLSQLDCRPSTRDALIRAASRNPAERFESVQELSQALSEPAKTPPKTEKPKREERALQGEASDALKQVRARLQAATNLNKRSEIYAKVPEELGDGEASLALVEELKGGNRNGFDLYWLWWITKEVGRERGFENRSRDLLARFFEHIPEPDDRELLRKIETPLDGRVDLWRKVPAEEGWVGENLGHRVKIVRPYWLGSVPVTNAQYAAFDPKKAPYEWPSVATERLATHPRVNVTWYEAVSFCRWLSTLPGFSDCRPRLPIEEEWEVACRAGSKTRFWKGDDDKDLDTVGWYSGNSGRRSHRGGSKPANEFGLYDVHGNAWEWTSSPSWQANRYAGRQGKVHPVDPADRPADIAESPRVQRVLRGGSYGLKAQKCRSAYGNFRGPGFEAWDQGFRVLLSSAPQRPLSRGPLRLWTPARDRPHGRRLDPPGRTSSRPVGQTSGGALLRSRGR